MREYMPRILVITVSFLLTIGISPLMISAGMTVKCADCHTMHDSEAGRSVTGTGPKPYLQRAAGSFTCWGCHAKGTTNNIDPVTGAPQVMHMNAVDLAGGNFAYITGNKSGTSGDTKTRGHNIADTGETDNNFSSGAYPPGDEFSQSGEGLNNTSFTCAGKFGCHGDRTSSEEFGGISGAHHSDRTMLQFGSINEEAQGLTVAASYRFLLGVKGGEDPDWQATVSGADHNEYKGADGGTESTRTSPGGNTVSGFCAECHGDFHGNASDTGGHSPWKRHPSDVSLPGAGTEYAGYTTYNTMVPVGRTVIPNMPGSSVNPDGETDDIVMCLSCHVAHAGPYKDMLRWNSADMIAGTTGDGAGNGCFVCHAGKDGI